MNAPLPQAPRARVEKAYFRAKYNAGAAGIAIGTASWELVELNETAHDASPAPSFAAIAASPYTADGSVYIYHPGTYDLDYRIGIYAGSDGGWSKARIRQTPTGDSESTMPYSQSIACSDTQLHGGDAAYALGSTKEIGTRCRTEITKITKVAIQAWCSIADMTIGNEAGVSAAGESAVFAWLTVTKV